jgi:hypothetical protein
MIRAWPVTSVVTRAISRPAASLMTTVASATGRGAQSGSGGTTSTGQYGPDRSVSSRTALEMAGLVDRLMTALGDSVTATVSEGVSVAGGTLVFAGGTPVFAGGTLAVGPVTALQEAVSRLRRRSGTMGG